ncbi:MAG: hypothetical protein RR528_00585, partial [Angelakisella sp.]
YKMRIAVERWEQRGSVILITSTKNRLTNLNEKFVNLFFCAKMASIDDSIWWSDRFSTPIKVLPQVIMIHSVAL